MVHLHESGLRGIQTRQSTSEVLSWAGLSCSIWDGILGKQQAFWDANASNSAFFPKSRRIATMGVDNVAVWELGEGQPSEIFKMNCSAELGVDGGFAFGLAISPDENHLYAGAGLNIVDVNLRGSTCRLFNPYHERGVAQLPINPLSGNVFSVSWSALYAPRTGPLNLEIICEWDANLGVPLRKLVGGEQSGDPRLAIDPTSKWLIDAEPDVPLRRISLQDGRLFQSKTISKYNPLGVSFHPDGDKFAVFDGDVWIFTCPDLELLKHTLVLAEGGNPAWGCGFLKDNSMVYGSISKGTIGRIDPIAGKILSEFAVCQPRQT